MGAERRARGLVARVGAIGVALVGLAAVAVACSGGPTPGSDIDCSGGVRKALDCSSEVAYQGVKTGGGVEILSIGNAQASYEDQAIRQVNEELGRYVAVQTRLCRDYNACIVSSDEYKDAASKTRELFATANELAKRADGAGRTKAVDELFARIVPDTISPEQLTLEIKVDVTLPDSVGGGRTVLKNGGPLPTAAGLAFTFKPSKDAYVYLYQTTPAGEVNVLFPNAKIQGVANPVAAGKATRIPADRHLRVNDKDLGTEKVFVLASVKPVAALDKSLAAAAAGAVNAKDDPLLSKVGASSDQPCQRGLEIDACPSERGLEIPPDDDVSMVARTAPADGAIVRVFTFEHLTEDAYAKLPKDQTSGSRGIVIHD